MGFRQVYNSMIQLMRNPSRAPTPLQIWASTGVDMRDSRRDGKGHCCVSNKYMLHLLASHGHSTGTWKGVYWLGVGG